MNKLMYAALFMSLTVTTATFAAPAKVTRLGEISEDQAKKFKLMLQLILTQSRKLPML